MCPTCYKYNIQLFVEQGLKTETFCQHHWVKSHNFNLLKTNVVVELQCLLAAVQLLEVSCYANTSLEYLGLVFSCNYGMASAALPKFTIITFF